MAQAGSVGHAADEQQGFTKPVDVIGASEVHTIKSLLVPSSSQDAVALNVIGLALV